MVMEYYSLLREIHAYVVPRTYVEVGVRHGESMTLARPGTRSIGIDPAADLGFPIGADAGVFAMTSDEFFARHDLRAELGGLPVDLAFIDGMHLFEFAVRDFANLERACGPGSVVLVHDCLPIDAVTSARDRTTDVWSGDVWKLVVCLRRHRPDLSISTIDVGPTGLGVVTGLDPTSEILRDSFEALYEEFVPLGYDDLLNADKGAALNSIPYDWDVITGVLDRRLGATAR